MKKAILFLLFTGSIFAQENQFTFSESGFTDYVVTNCPNKSKEEIYQKTIDWISVTYNDPKEVIKAQIQNDYIRFQALKKNVLLGTFMGLETMQDYKYHIEVSVKDGKYKFDVIDIEVYTPSTQYTAGYWSSLNLVNTKGNYKNGKIKPSVKFLPTELPKIFNELNESLFTYINNNEVSKKNEW